MARRKSGGEGPDVGFGTAACFRGHYVGCHVKNHVLLLLLFFVLYAADTLGFDLSLAPGLSVKNAFLYLLFVGLAIEAAVTRRRSMELASVLVPFTLYVAYAIFMWIVVLLILDYPNYSPRSSLFALKGGPIDNLVVLLVFFYGVTDAKRALWVLLGILWLVVVGNVVTVLDALDMPDLGLIELREDGRVGGPVGSSNPFGYLLALFVPVIFALCFTESGLKRKLAVIGLLFSILALLMTVSRGALLGLLGGGLLAAFFLRRQVPLAMIGKLAFATIAVALVAFALAYGTGYGELLLDRLDRFDRGSHDLSSGRTMIWGLMLEKMLESPLTFVTGFGWHAYQTFQRSLEFGFSPHSHYLSVLFNLGIIGLAFWMLAAASILRVTLHAIPLASPSVRPLLLGFFVGFLALLVALIFNDSVPWIYIWALVGLCLRVAVSQQQLAGDPMSRPAAVGFSRRSSTAGVASTPVSESAPGSDLNFHRLSKP
jgi:O-antigen ligase